MRVDGVAGYSATELIHEAMVDAIEATVRLDDTTLLVRPGWWQLITPSLSGWLNEIVCDHLPPAQADAILDAAIADYRRQGLRFRWTLMPGATPSDLAARLAARGLTPTPSHVMARATADAPAVTDPAIEIREVGTAELATFTRVMAEGWGADPAVLHVMNERSLAQRPQRTRMFLALHDGQPAGGAASMDLARSTYLLGAVVLPAFRRRGLYPALVHTRMRHAAARGLRCATSIARAATSNPILARLGFERLAVLDELTDQGPART